jgi:hypothetical protein
MANSSPAVAPIDRPQRCALSIPSACIRSAQSSARAAWLYIATSSGTSDGGQPRAA